MNAKILVLATLLAATPMFAQQAADGFGALDTSAPAGITVPQIIEKIGKQE